MTDDGATLCLESAEDTALTSTKEASLLKAITLRAAVLTLSEAIEAEKRVAANVASLTGACKAHSTEVLKVVVTGRLSDTISFYGTSTVDAGSGMVDTVASLSGGTLALKRTKLVGRVTDEETAKHTRKEYNSTTGINTVEVRKKVAGRAKTLKEFKSPRAKGRDVASGSFKPTDAGHVETKFATEDTVSNTTRVTKDASE